MKAFAEAVRMGFPAYSRKVAPGMLLVITESGRAVYGVRELEDPISGDRSIAVSLGMDYGAVVLAEPSGGGWKLYPERVPDAVALEPAVMSRFEADAWSRRISLLTRGSYEQFDLGVKGFKAVVLETGWEVAVLHEPLGLSVVWINCLTNTHVIPLKWQARMGLLKSGYKTLEERARELASKAVEAGACSRAGAVSSRT